VEEFYHLCGFLGGAKGIQNKYSTINEESVSPEAQVKSDCKWVLVPKKDADIDKIVRQAKLKAVHKYFGDYRQSYIWAGDIEKFTKELEENIARELKSIFALQQRSNLPDYGIAIDFRDMKNLNK